MTTSRYAKQQSSKLRIATVADHFGKPQEYYKRVLRAHIRHSLVNHAKVQDVCFEIVDDTRNKPTFILGLLLSEIEHG